MSFYRIIKALDQSKHLTLPRCSVRMTRRSQVHVWVMQSIYLQPTVIHHSPLVENSCFKNIKAENPMTLNFVSVFDCFSSSSAWDWRKTQNIYNYFKIVYCTLVLNTLNINPAGIFTQYMELIFRTVKKKNIQWVPVIWVQTQGYNEEKKTTGWTNSGKLC